MLYSIEVTRQKTKHDMILLPRYKIIMVLSALDVGINARKLPYLQISLIQ